jgi:hypothetical protein
LTGGKNTGYECRILDTGFWILDKANQASRIGSFIQYRSVKGG